MLHPTAILWVHPPGYLLFSRMQYSVQHGVSSPWPCIHITEVIMDGHWECIHPYPRSMDLRYHPDPMDRAIWVSRDLWISWDDPSRVSPDPMDPGMTPSRVYPWIQVSRVLPSSSAIRILLHPTAILWHTPRGYLLYSRYAVLRNYLIAVYSAIRYPGYTHPPDGGSMGYPQILWI